MSQNFIIEHYSKCVCTLIVVYFQHLATCGWRVWRFSTKIYSVKIRKFFVTVNEKKLLAKATAVKKLMLLQLRTVYCPYKESLQKDRRKGFLFANVPLIQNWVSIMACQWEQMPEACNFIDKRLQHRCFPLKFTKLLRITNLRNISERMLL